MCTQTFVFCPVSEHCLGTVDTYLTKCELQNFRDQLVKIGKAPPYAGCQYGSGINIVAELEKGTRVCFDCESRLAELGGSWELRKQELQEVSLTASDTSAPRLPGLQSHGSASMTGAHIFPTNSGNQNSHNIVSESNSAVTAQPKTDKPNESPIVSPNDTKVSVAPGYLASATTLAQVEDQFKQAIHEVVSKGSAPFPMVAATPPQPENPKQKRKPRARKQSAQANAKKSFLAEPPNEKDKSGLERSPPQSRSIAPREGSIYQSDVKPDGGVIISNVLPVQRSNKEQLAPLIIKAVPSNAVLEAQVAQRKTGFDATRTAANAPLLPQNSYDARASFYSGSINSLAWPFLQRPTQQPNLQDAQQACIITNSSQRAGVSHKSLSDNNSPAFGAAPIGNPLKRTNREASCEEFNKQESKNLAMPPPKKAKWEPKEGQGAGSRGKKPAEGKQ